jgi:hypothetical protein
MKIVRTLALFGAAMLAVVGGLKAADMIFSTGDQFEPLGFMTPQGEDLNVIVDRVNGLSDGTYTVTDLNVSDDAAIGDALGVTGITTPTGGVASAGGFTASCRTFAVGGNPAMLAADGNNSTPVITEQYVSEIFVPYNCTATGVSVFNGSDVTGNVLVGLGNTAGAVLATSAATAGSGTDAYQRVAFTAPLALKGPATYYVLTQYSSATARYNTHAVGNFGCVADTGNTFGTLTSFTPPTTFVTNVCNIASLY